VLLLAPPFIEAVLVPVAPALPCTYADPSALLVARMSNSSVIPLGGWNDFLPLTPKKPTMTSPGAVVVIDGELTDLDDGLNAPPCASTGEDVLIPLKSRTPPAIGALEGNDHVNVVGSDDPATL
jgi:hypothetical protein